MKEITEDPDFKVFIWEKDEQIDIQKHGPGLQITPIEFHVKVDGSLDDKPSFCFVLKDAFNGTYFSQITEHMMAPALKALGYTKTEG